MAGPLRRNIGDSCNDCAAGIFAPPPPAAAAGASASVCSSSDAEATNGEADPVGRLVGDEELERLRPTPVVFEPATVPAVVVLAAGAGEPDRSVPAAAFDAVPLLVNSRSSLVMNEPVVLPVVPAAAAAVGAVLVLDGGSDATAAALAETDGGVWAVPSLRWRASSRWLEVFELRMEIVDDCKTVYELSIN